MTKNELIDRLLREVRQNHNSSMKRTDMENVLAALCKIARAELLAGGEVPLSPLGKLKMKEMQARIGRNPRTGETIQIPARRKAVFMPGKDFRESCARGDA